MKTKEVRVLVEATIRVGAKFNIDELVLARYNDTYDIVMPSKANTNFEVIDYHKCEEF